ncbi:nose resistant to fluoxetine protein 6-like [Cloeon dipterum]|uniref:nose resistant to fluoxetine protein 6-like n=1 Tax=Cloeon dipterum TaxID=197152 RepID=UPI00321F86DF
MTSARLAGALLAALAWALCGPRVWALEPLLSFDDAADQNCRHDAALYRSQLQNFTLWAVKMYDASAKAPVGILAGATFQLGHFDECLQVGSEEAPTPVVALPAPLRAQYCVARIRLEPEQATYPGFHRLDRPHAFSLQYDPRDSAWEKLMVPLDPSKKPRNSFHWATCIPASCSPADLKVALDAALQPLRQRHEVQLSVDVDEKLCTVAQRMPLSTADIAVLTVILLVFGIVVAATFFDMAIYRQRPSGDERPLTRGQEILMAFSACTNLEKLNKPDPTDDLGILHGLRLFSMVFIILGHRCLFSYGGPFFNPEFLEERYRKIEDMFLLNGTLLVDTFFVLSGFLTCFGILLEIHKRKTLNVPMLYLYRWMRLTPVYMMVVAFYATLFSKVDSGPLWKARVGLEQERCVQNWWTNLLYVNNYVNADQLCMFQSWYIACDMHYFLLAPLIVIPLYKSPKLGLALLAGVTSLSIVIPFAVTYVGEYSGVLRVYMSLLEDPPSNEDYYAVYIKSHNRAAPYFIGMAAAYLYGILKLSDIKIPKGVMWGCSLAATVVGLTSMFGAWVFYIPGREYFAGENAAYASLHRVGWALTVAWVVLGGCTTRFGVLQPLLQLNAFLPLSRLTYCAFLTHGAVQLYTLATLRQPEFMSFPKLFWMASGDITISFIVALFVHLFFEAPLGAIQKMLLRKKRANRPRNENAPAAVHMADAPPPPPVASTPPPPEISSPPAPRDTTPEIPETLTNSKAVSEV